MVDPKAKTFINPNFNVSELPADDCGAVMSSIDGIDAYSNGADQGTYNSCGGTGTYGFLYQCVELAQRYFAIMFGTPNLWDVEYASDMCSTMPAGFFLLMEIWQ